MVCGCRAAHRHGVGRQPIGRHCIRCRGRLPRLRVPFPSCASSDYRRCGIGAHLLEQLEDILTACPGVTKLEVVFHNPVHLPWLIPDAGGDWHPCLPGGRYGFRTAHSAQAARLAGFRRAERLSPPCGRLHRPARTGTAPCGTARRRHRADAVRPGDPQGTAGAV